MANSLLKQIQYENETWKKVIYTMMDENVHFKLRLTEVLKPEHEKNFLEKAENFQTCFLELDEKILILRDHLTRLNKLIMEKNETDQQMVIIKNSRNDFRTNMNLLENHFNKLREDFNQYLFKNYDNGEPIKSKAI
ncbi:MAG: hypothetical protein ABJB16_07390 [Saprospiraceae bacterium]